MKKLDISIPLYVRDVINRLEASGYEAYIAGGCIRDFLLGRQPKDYDITTNAHPEQAAACFGDDCFKVIETGIKHGTITVVSEGENVEVTTYRVDGVYKDHRRPESVRFAERLEDDL